MVRLSPECTILLPRTVHPREPVTEEADRAQGEPAGVLQAAAPLAHVQEGLQVGFQFLGDEIASFASLAPTDHQGRLAVSQETVPDLERGYL